LISAKIVEKHDRNLSIRRYVDNTPEPEPEDVRAHLIGGVPVAEIESKKCEFDKFGVDPSLIFESDREDYYRFRPEIKNKPDIRRILEASSSLQKTYDRMDAVLNAWWELAKHDFAKLEGNNILPEVRSELMHTLKDKLVPIGVLDEFKTAGVFVNWWQIIRYDLKTIIAIGWNEVLIPDEYLIAAFFEEIADEMATLEANLGEAEDQFEEAIEAVEYEADEDEAVTAASLKKHLKSLIDDLQGTKTPSAVKERKQYEKLRQAIIDAEDRKKEINTAIRAKQSELETKLNVKRHGADAEKQEANLLLKQLAAQIPALDPESKDDKKRIKALKKDQKVLEERISHADLLLKEIGGQLTADEAKNLILKKLYDAMRREMSRYLNTERRTLTSSSEQLWDKYAISLSDLRDSASASQKMLDCQLRELRYYG
jgi:type I restriction enzyme M protein